MFEPFIDTLLACPLFRNISRTELIHLIPCLKPQMKTYQEDELVLQQGMTVSFIYILLEGQVEITKSSFSGLKNIVAVLTPGKLFGEGIVCTTMRHSPVTATALTQTTLLCLPYERIIGGCDKGCGFHHALIYNMMLLLGEKNYQLNSKMDLLLLKGMREKIAAYLLLEAAHRHTSAFTISLNRNQLAEYLNVSRPSMCRELNRMKEEGLIDYYQNSFKLLDLPKLKQYT